VNKPNGSEHSTIRRLGGAIEASEGQWESVSQSLIEIVKRLEDLWEQMNQTSEAPDKATTREVAEYLDQLFKKLRELDRWLKKKKEQHWLVLRNGVNSAKTNYLNSESRVSLDTYIAWLNNEHNEKNLPIEEIRSYRKQRFIVADAINQLAEELEDAVEQVQEEK
jgi:transketolase